MRIKGILFDKDDTIIHLAPFWQEPVHRTAEFLLDRCGRSRDATLAARLERAAGFDGDMLLPSSPVVAGTNRDVIDACAAVLAEEGFRMDKALHEEGVRYLEYACIQYGTVAGTTDFSVLLPQLKDMNIHLGVATSDQYDVTMHCLQSLGINAYFDLVLGADLVTQPKPYPEMALRFCHFCGIDLSEAVMVGDSANDMRFAQNSGMTGVFFQSQTSSSALPEGAAYALADLSQLPGLIHRINAGKL